MQTEIKKADAKTVVTRQVYYLAGVLASKLNKPNHELSLLTTLDENSTACACSEVEDGKKDFVIVIKNLDGAVEDATSAGMIEKFKRFANVAYLESRNGHTVVNRYLIGDHTDKASEAEFFEAVRQTIKKTASHRGWQIDEQGTLIKSAPQYFY